ncbi:nucleoside deaminase [Thermoleptolyngbya sp. M55_K2018_002]|uniref:nucleoside deaminase n=1 Tax=Thermoleptolyngbya sp. M55_K2018_002 TaxID=2747808 RepID=UPI0025F3D35D|nr:nucleoside deaminase [Thermoleptolyngbya sp. M55_K2018_002]
MPYTFDHPDPTTAQMLHHLRRANAIALRARGFGHHPFGAILVAPDHETVLLEQGNVNPVNHAESVLVRVASTNFSPEYLWNCTLYTTAEPCVMCAGTQYWGNIGRLVYGIAETSLLALTGSDAQNPTLSLPCRQVFAAGQKPIRVWGPFDALEAEIMQVHQDFWRSP